MQTTYILMMFVIHIFLLFYQNIFVKKVNCLHRYLIRFLFLTWNYRYLLKLHEEQFQTISNMFLINID